MHLKFKQNRTECLIVGKKCDIRRLGGIRGFGLNGKYVNASDKVKKLRCYYGQIFQF